MTYTNGATVRANTTRPTYWLGSLVLLSQRLPYHIGHALEILETSGIFQTLRKIPKLTQIVTRNEVRGTASAKGNRQKWKGFEIGTNDVECLCELQLLRLSGIAAAPTSLEDSLGISPYHQLINNCPEHLR